MTERVGYWVDMSNPYWTMSPEYVDSVWWALNKINDEGLLVRDHRVAPYCPRCGTGLSDHEVAQGYEAIVDPSVYVRLPIVGQLHGLTGVDLLVWTTTPWTLVSNTAVAVHPDVTYVVARTRQGTFVVAEPLLVTVLGEEAEILAALSGSSLAGMRYRRPFDLVDIPHAHFVITADYVTTEDGTGLVHQAPAFGADDLAAGRRHNLPVVNPIGPDGHFLADVDLVSGTFFKDADSVLIADVTFACPTCGEQSTRVSEVIDAWFDSGSMPFASIGYPYVDGSVERFKKSYPAQFICEAIDQTRGWFYTLMAICTSAFDRSSYENVVCLGHIVAEDGRKMSKHLGNVIEPIPFMEKHGADALRWFMLCSGSPWSARRVGDSPLEEIVRKVLLTYWNTASFFTLYANTSFWVPGTAAPVADRPV